MKKKKDEIAIRSSAAEYLTYVASVGDQQDSIRGMEEHEQFISVVGHTATDNRRIWVSPSGRTIRIDCGAGYKCYGKEGTLGAIRLNDMKEFYIN